MRCNATLRSLRLLATATTIAIAAGCDRSEPLLTAPDLSPTAAGHRGRTASLLRTVVQLRSATARYHRLENALADGFVFLHGCETRPDEGPAGMLYVHFDRLLDGVLDPRSPDALLYEPGKAGRARLVGVELAIPYTMWPEPEPPTLHGHVYQPEDEFGVWGLHIWVWRHNPEGLFAESNPRVSCDTPS